MTVRPTMTSRVSRRAGLLCLATFGVLLVGLPVATWSNDAHELDLFDAFYRAGALVFGGGHVVLPLLEAEVVAPGWISENAFVAGCGAAQAVPGPLFTCASYLGAVSERPRAERCHRRCDRAGRHLSARLSDAAWSAALLDCLRGTQWAPAALAGTNAAVVGILANAFLDPVWPSAIGAPSDVVIAAAGFVALSFAKIPTWAVVAGVSVASTLHALI
ncbi:chromate transporter [Novosphingobium sp. RD2P27]|uniref:Chromate transporter n=1 Tax=Novosphingobium kalidii TaxID=3230299 RepID=A0ABV2D218_9SPHN